jgi:hypothetical protein
VVVAVLALAVVVNYTNLLSPDIYRAKDAPPPPPGRLVVEPSEPVYPVEPIGPADALVKLEVFYELDNPCHAYIEPDARSFTDRYAPHVQLKLMPWNAEGTQERADQLGVDCLLAIAISGRDEQDSPSRGNVVFTAPTEIGGWSWDDVAALVDTRLAEAGISQLPIVADESSEVADGLEDAADPDGTDAASNRRGGT